MKTYISIFILVCCSNISIAQNKQTEILLNLIKSQKAYISTQVLEKERSKYSSLIHFATVIHPKIFEEIQKVDSTFWSNPDSVNILESFPGYGNIEGVIWKGNGVYYNYLLDADKKLSVHRQAITQLQDTLKTIVQSFSGWNNPIFSINGLALGSPTDHPFYLASKYSKEAVQTIGFYYQ